MCVGVCMCMSVHACVCVCVSVCENILSPFPSPELVHDEDLTVGFIRLNNLPAMFAVEINNGQEYVLCFNGTSEYV